MQPKCFIFFGGFIVGAVSSYYYFNNYPQPKIKPSPICIPIRENIMCGI